MATYTLKKPYHYDGIEYTEFELDFDTLTGKDIISAETQYRQAGHDDTILVKEMSKAYLAYVVATAAKVLPEVILHLPAKDFTAITIKARNFLLLGV